MWRLAFNSTGINLDFTVKMSCRIITNGKSTIHIFAYNTFYRKSRGSRSYWGEYHILCLGSLWPPWCLWYIQTAVRFRCWPSGSSVLLLTMAFYYTISQSSKVTTLRHRLFQNNMDELWTLLHFINPQSFASLNDFIAQWYGDIKSTEHVDERARNENISTYSSLYTSCRWLKLSRRNFKSNTIVHCMKSI